MNLTDYHSSNHHTVIEFGRLMYLVSSNSRKHLIHLVDMEPCDDYVMKCACEAHKYGERVCRHISSVVEYLLAPLNLEDEEWHHAKSTISLSLQLGFNIQEAIQRALCCVSEKSKNPRGSAAKNTEQCAAPRKRMYSMDGVERRERIRVRSIPTPPDKST